MVDFVIANCDFEGRRLIKGGLSPKKIRTVYNCLNLPFPDNTNKDFELMESLNVACDSGGVPEIVQDNVAGILVPPKNPEKLAEAILYLLQNREKGERMGLAGREIVKNYFAQERLIKEVGEIYSNLLGE